MPVIQKKICMVGVFATGKTSLVRRFVHSKFSERYHSTIGVKIDRKEVEVGGDRVNFLLWDLAGKDNVQSIRNSYLRGASGVVFVVDGTRRETVTDLANLMSLVKETLGEVPAVIAFNKADLEDQWQVGLADLREVSGKGRFVLETSAKTGTGVNEAFGWLASQLLKA
jgi:small GTP-binding protein